MWTQPTEALTARGQMRGPGRLLQGEEPEETPDSSPPGMQSGGVLQNTAVHTRETRPRKGILHTRGDPWVHDDPKGMSPEQEVSRSR